MYHHHESKKQHQEGSQISSIIGENSIRYGFEIVKLLDEEFENRRYFIKSRSMISHVCNGGYKGRFCICSEYGEPIHVEGRSFSLDGRETYHEVFQRNFGFQIMHGGKYIALRGFCYTDWVGIANDWRSTTGYMLLVGVGGILWKCKKQPTIALSTTEVEYTTTSHCMK